MRVLSATQVVTEKLNSLNEHHCDFAAQMPAIRGVRERVDWDRGARRHRGNDFAVAFLVLIRPVGDQGLIRGAKSCHAAVSTPHSADSTPGR